MRAFALIGLLVYGIELGVGLGAYLQQEPVLPATTIDLNAQRVVELQQQLAERDALAIGLRADVATCEANTEQTKRQLQSVLLTDDVAKAITALERAYPGSKWLWNNDARRIVRVPKE